MYVIEMYYATIWWSKNNNKLIIFYINMHAYIYLYNNFQI